MNEEEKKRLKEIKYRFRDLIKNKSIYQDWAEIMEWLFSQLAEKDREIERWKEQSFQPLGDNHHNAALCPYCSPDRKTIEADRDRWKARAERLEKLLRAEGHDKQGRPHHVICKACAALEEKP